MQPERCRGGWGVSQADAVFRFCAIQLASAIFSFWDIGMLRVVDIQLLPASVIFRFCDIQLLGYRGIQSGRYSVSGIFNFCGF